MKSNQVFVFVGEGEGVPGLPHRLTMEEAKELKVDDLLEQAIANGIYVLEPEEDLILNDAAMQVAQEYKKTSDELLSNMLSASKRKRGKQWQ